jgi:hypothetical protein
MFIGPNPPINEETIKKLINFSKTVLLAGGDAKIFFY